MEKLLEFATSVPDFRRTGKGNIRHRLEDVLILIILARMSKCIGRADIIEFGRHNLTRFRSMGMLKNGVPSEPTMCRIENGIDESSMADSMRAFMGLFHEELTQFMSDQEIICVDGKAMCGTTGTCCRTTSRGSRKRQPGISTPYSALCTGCSIYGKEGARKRLTRPREWPNL